MRKTMLAALIVTAASVLTLPAFAQDAAPAKADASATSTAAAATPTTDQGAAKSTDAGHKATTKHTGHKAKAAPATDGAAKADGGAPTATK